MSNVHTNRFGDPNIKPDDLVPIGDLVRVGARPARVYAHKYDPNVVNKWGYIVGWLDEPGCKPIYVPHAPSDDGPWKTSHINSPLELLGEQAR